MQLTTTFEEISGPAGSIRMAVTTPSDRKRPPAVIFYSDIFQLTGPHLRLADRLAKRGFAVFAPELYGRFEPAGTVLDFERDRHRALADADKLTVADVDADRRALLDHLTGRKDIDTSRIYAAGFCFGGHLAFRAALERDIRATACFYPTTIHSNRLGGSALVDSLARAEEIRTPLLLVWGTRDPHIPAEGRALIHATLDAAGVRYRALELDAEHAFMRDEGPRHDPVATDTAMAAMLELFEL